MTISFDFNPPAEGSRTVEVFFFQNDVFVHSRNVNACYTDSVYDEAATEARIDEIARGLESKIAAGAVTAPNLDEPYKEIETGDKKLSKAEKDARREAYEANLAQKKVDIAARKVKAEARKAAKDAEQP